MTRTENNKTCPNFCVLNLPASGQKFSNLVPTPECESSEISKLLIFFYLVKFMGGGSGGTRITTATAAVAIKSLLFDLDGNECK